MKSKTSTASVSSETRKRSNRRWPVVLVLDGMPDVHDYVRLCLRPKIRCRVIGAEVSGQALKLARENEVDVVIFNLARPGDMDGLEFFKRFEPEHPEIPAIFLSAYLETHGTHAQELGVFRCVEKPPRRGSFCAVVREALEYRKSNQK